MNKHLRKLLLASLLVSASASATEMRTPWSATNGPLRYTFEKLHKDKGALNVWSAMHMKEASRAFLKHSTKTKDISALIFNKENFTLNEIFPDSTVPLNSANYNPYMAVKSLSPRVEYMEYGMTLGMRWDMQLGQKGRVGLRASVPFRRIEMERQDSGLDKLEDPSAEFTSKKLITIDRNDLGADDQGGKVDVVVTAYRMDLLERLRNANNTAIMVGDVNSFRVLNGQIAVPNANTDRAAALVTISGNDGKPLYHALMRDGAASSNAGRAASRLNVAQWTDMANTYANLPVDNTTVNRFIDNVDYSGTLASPGFIASKAKSWLIFRRQTTSPDAERFGAGQPGQSGVGGAIARGIDNILSQFKENPFTFLAKNGYTLDSNIRESMGDIDLDVFYEHVFNNQWMGEINAGVRIPTGGDQDQFGGAYKPMAGNGEHWELMLGVLGCYQPLSWMNVKVDGKVSFALEATEHRMATFAGSKIRNMGPRADADVDWASFTGHCDFNFFHPKDNGIRTMLGYEFYYKTEDRVSYKKKEMQSWLGGTVADANGNLKTLDNKLARALSERIAHKVRFETSAQLLKHFEVFVGGGLTFAGMNVQRDRDAHGGFNVRF